jgi:hypothetical protein
MIGFRANLAGHAGYVSGASVKSAERMSQQNSHDERAEPGDDEMHGLAQFKIAYAREQYVTDHDVKEPPEHVDQRA